VSVPFLAPEQVAAFFCVLARVSPLFLLAPLFSSKTIPARARGVVAVALAVGLSPVAASGVHVPVETWALAGTIGKELLVGAAFAYAVGAIYAALQVAGSLLDLTMGFSFAASIDPINGNQSAVIQNAYGLVGTLIFLTIGGEEWLLRGLAHTYDVVGLTNAPPLGGLVKMVTEAFAGIFVSAIQVAGPVLLALILTDAAFGVVSRVVPQLNVFAMGFAVKVIVGLVLIGVSLPFVADWLSGKLPEVVVG
jgi:flagellar biosynthetic protein FliR